MRNVLHPKGAALSLLELCLQDLLLQDLLGRSIVLGEQSGCFSNSGIWDKVDASTEGWQAPGSGFAVKVTDNVGVSTVPGAVDDIFVAKGSLFLGGRDEASSIRDVEGLELIRGGRRFDSSEAVEEDQAHKER